MGTNRKAALMAAVASCLTGVKLAQAGNFVWDGGDGSSTSWSVGANWGGDSAPSATTDTITFDNTGAGSLNNTVDPASALSFQQLSYRLDDTTKTYFTSIDRNVTLTINGAGIAPGNTVTTTNSSLIVLPLNPATTGNRTGVNVVIRSSGTGTAGDLKISNADVLINGRPGASVNADSFAILDLSQLDKFTFAQPLPQGGTTNSAFLIGQGNSTIGSGGDNNAYWGKLILAPDSSINSNRFGVGGSNGAGTTGSAPVSSVLFGAKTVVNNVVSGAIYCGSDAGVPSATGSGLMMFQSGLTAPTLTIGDLASSPNNLEIARGRRDSSGNQYGVFDMTSASAGSDGIFNCGFFSINIGAQQTRSATATSGSGGGFGILSFDNGIMNVGSILVGRTTAPNSNQPSAPVQGVLNVGLKGTEGDAGKGFISVGTISIGHRLDASNNVAVYGIVNVANSGTITADRIFVGNNTQATGVNSPVTAILNLGGGTVTANQIQAGSDTAQAGTTTRLVNFNGGALKVRTSTTFGGAFLKNMTAAYVYTNGGTVDTNGMDATIDQPLLAPAGSGLSSVTISDGGSGYRAAPLVLITGGDGVGATAVATINSSGVVTGINITNPGTGYTVAPTIQLVANGGTTLANTLVPYGGTAATLVANLGLNSSSGGITKAGAGVLSLTGSNTYGGATTVAAGTLKVNTAAATPLLGNAAGTDIKGGRVVFDYTAAADQAAYKANLKSIVTTAYASNFATGQIHSSTATTQIGLGYKDNSASSSFTVARAYYGDVNLDGTVTTDDFDVLATNFNKSGQDWINGDFNYDGVVNVLDFNSIATNYGSSLPVAAPALGALVPEPASITLIGLAGLGLVRRRRH